MTINLSLILLDNTDTVVSASWDTDGYVISRQNNPVDWVILHWYACGADRKDMRLRDYQNFSEGKITTFS